MDMKTSVGYGGNLDLTSLPPSSPPPALSLLPSFLTPLPLPPSLSLPPSISSPFLPSLSLLPPSPDKTRQWPQSYIWQTNGSVLLI